MADIALLEHVAFGADLQRIHAACDAYVPLHDACDGHVRLARAAGSEIVRARRPRRSAPCAPARCAPPRDSLKAVGRMRRRWYPYVGKVG